MKRKKVAFICVHNSCRSQLAEALGKYYASDVFDSYSAGTEIKDKINEDAVRILKELSGIDMISNGHYSKLLSAIPSPDIAISMGCNVECPFVGRSFDDNWQLDDPTGKDDEAFINTIAIIKDKILKLRQELLAEQYDLKRFLLAQETDYGRALSEIRNGHKMSHWMWYIFPQISNLGQSPMAKKYAIDGLAEARAYVGNDLLRKRLHEISEALLMLAQDDITAVMGYPDNLKLQSCMTLFELAEPDCRIYSQVLDKYYQGERDRKTLKLLQVRL